MDRFGMEMGKFPWQTMEKWPRREDGDYVAPIKLTHCKSSDTEDVMLVNML